MAPLVPLLQQSWQKLQSETLFFNILMISLVFFISVCVFWHKLTRKCPKLNLPPSPPKLPIIGNLHQLGTLPHRSLEVLSKKYGPVMLMHLGYTPTLVITSAEIAKEMTKMHDIVCSDRPKTRSTDILLYGAQDLAFGPYGEHWRQARKLCVHQLLSLKRVQSFQFIREEEVALLIQRMLLFSCTNDSVNLTEVLIDASSNIICRCVIGKRSEKEEDGKNKLGDLSRRLSMQLVSFSFGDFFPCLGWIDVLTGLISRLKDLFQQWDSYLDQVIEEHQLNSKSKDQQDFVDILLQLRSDDLLDFVLTQEKLKAILLDMIAAGSETSSTTMEWIMAELVRNPTIMKKAQEEVRRVVGTNKSKVEESDIYQMGYLKCVVKEALRLHCPFPLMVPRGTLASIKLGGYDIPAKTRVLVNTWAIQRDPRIWGNKAEEFIPERFENNPVDFRGQDFEFIPFGVGRRGCPGMSFGVASVEYVIASLLYRFDWALPDGLTPENMDMSEVFGQTSPKKVPLQLIPTLPLYSP